MAMLEDSRGTFWVATERKGLFQFDRATHTFRSFAVRDRAAAGERDADDSFFAAFLEQPAGTLWAAGYGAGLVRIDLASGRTKRYLPDPRRSDSLSVAQVVQLAGDGDRLVYVGTENGGLDVLDVPSERFTHYRPDLGDPRSLGSASIWALYRDEQGLVWAGTNGFGVSWLSPLAQRFEAIRAGRDGLGDPRVTSIAEGEDGRIWVGTDGGGLHVVDPRTGRVSRLPASPRRPWLGFECRAERAGRSWRPDLGRLLERRALPDRHPRRPRPVLPPSGWPALADERQHLARPRRRRGRAAGRDERRRVPLRRAPRELRAAERPLPGSRAGLGLGGGPRRRRRPLARAPDERRARGPAPRLGAAVRGRHPRRRRLRGIVRGRAPRRRSRPPLGGDGARVDLPRPRRSQARHLRRGRRPAELERGQHHGGRVGEHLGRHLRRAGPAPRSRGSAGGSRRARLRRAGRGDGPRLHSRRRVPLARRRALLRHLARAHPLPAGGVPDEHPRARRRADRPPARQSPRAGGQARAPRCRARSRRRPSSCCRTSRRTSPSRSRRSTTSCRRRTATRTGWKGSTATGARSAPRPPPPTSASRRATTSSASAPATTTASGTWRGCACACA